MEQHVIESYDTVHNIKLDRFDAWRTVEQLMKKGSDLRKTVEIASKKLLKFTKKSGTS